MARKRPGTVSAHALVPTLRVGTSALAASRLKKKCSGFTLLELVLALGLTTIVLGLVSAAVFSLFRFLDVRRTQLEESQVARAVLRRVADDLKGTVHATTLDFSGVSGLSNPTSGTGDVPGEGGENQPPANNPTGGESGGSANEKTETEDSDSGTTTSDSSLPHTKPGLYGTQYTLEIDVSRLPRIDEYSPVLLGKSQAATIPSDVKTIAYFVRSAADAGGSQNVGLVRREVDRSVTLYAAENGDLGSLEASETVLAPEVVALEFRYFNGTEWVSEWNSEDEGALPVAVEVAIAVGQSEAIPEEVTPGQPPALDPAAALSGTDDFQIYRLVVPLPTAEPPKDESETMEADSTSSSSENEQVVP